MARLLSGPAAAISASSRARCGVALERRGAAEDEERDVATPSARSGAPPARG